MRETDEDYRAALAEAEEEALHNNYLGVKFDGLEEEYDESLSQSASSQIAEKARQNASILSSEKDFRKMTTLKIGHESRPMWVCPNGHIYLETQSKYFALATDFVVAIAEPESRPEFIHHYKITPYSLYAAVSVNLDTETIIGTLERFSKIPVPSQVKKFITSCTESHGKASLVLKRNRLYIESKYPNVLKDLLKIRAIRESKEDSLSAKLRQLNGDVEENDSNGNATTFMEAETTTEDKAALATNFEEMEELEMMERRLANVDEVGDEDDDDEEEEAAAQRIKVKKEPQDDSKLANGKRKRNENENENESKQGNTKAAQKTKTLSFEIKPDLIEQVKEAAMKADYPLNEEYDFRNDERNPNVPNMSLRATTKVRPYQEKSLAKMFGNGRARSGIIVLPCGAGKTLTGITAACTIRKSCIIFCINSVGVEQWIRSIRSFTTIPPDHIRRFTSKTKDDLHPSGATVLVTTYNMMSYSRGRSEDGERVMSQVKNTEWGLILMDEVHVVPAKMFRMALRHVKSHCKLGLTATLVREDNLIDDLNFLIGPKLYEANWLALTDQGYLAKVLCAEVWCPMTADFFEKYLDPSTPGKIKQLLYVMNPNKFAVAKMLMNYHRARNDKVLIFSDNIPAIKAYSVYLRVHNMYGATSATEREEVLRRFRGGKEVAPGEEINVLIISQVGDVGIDLPQANVIIQISSHFGSRRQEAQRLGRILRPKAGETFNIGFNSFFYSLISQDCAEMYFSHKRQQYLTAQGYTFKVIRDIEKIAEEAGIPYEELTQEQQRIMLEDLHGDNIRELDFKNSKSSSSSSSSSSKARRKTAAERQKALPARLRRFVKAQQRK